MTITDLPVQNKILRETISGTAFTDVSVSFGDGYSQTAPKGINPRNATYDIKWGNLTREEFNTIISTLDTVGSWGVLSWTPAHEVFSAKLVNVFSVGAGTTIYFASSVAIPYGVYTLSATAVDGSIVTGTEVINSGVYTYLSLINSYYPDISPTSTITLSLPKKFRMSKDGYKTSIVNNTLFSVSCSLKQVYVLV